VRKLLEKLKAFIKRRRKYKPRPKSYKRSLKRDKLTLAKKVYSPSRKPKNWNPKESDVWGIDTPDPESKGGRLWRLFKRAKGSKRVAITKEANINWNWLKQNYVAEVKGPDEKYMFKRRFLGTRENWSSSGKNATIKLAEKEVPKRVGSILEVRDPSHKHDYRAYYKKRRDGWHLIAHRCDRTVTVHLDKNKKKKIEI